MIAYGPDAPLRIAHLVRTCMAHPAQWAGLSEHRADVYIRYRHGGLTVRVGLDAAETMFEGARADFWEHPVWADEDDRRHPENGQMTDDELRARLPAWIELPPV